MVSQINFAPMQELLTNAAGPQTIAQMLDHLAQDYSRSVMELELYAQGSNTGMSTQAPEHLWLLYALRDAFMACDK
jgi:hypothetical protein